MTECRCVCHTPKYGYERCIACDAWHVANEGGMRKLVYRILFWLDEWLKGRIHIICDYRHGMEAKYPELMD